jgi:hypothetical protein
MQRRHSDKFEEAPNRFGWACRAGDGDFDRGTGETRASVAVSISNLRELFWDDEIVWKPNQN